MFLIDSLFDEHDLLQALRYWDTIIHESRSPFHISDHFMVDLLWSVFKKCLYKKAALEERETLIANGTDSFTFQSNKYRDHLAFFLRKKFAYIEGH